MDVQASEQPQQPLLWYREHSMNKIIIEMLEHISSNYEARQQLSLEQVEAFHAVMLTTYNSMSAETAPDDTKRLTHLHDALLQQNNQTICVLDELSLQFFKELIFKCRIGKAKPALAEKEPVPACQTLSTTGLQLQGIDPRESRVSRMRKQIELQVEASTPPDQSLARVGSLHSKAQISLPESDISANASTDPPIVDLLQSPDSESPAADPQIPAHSLSEASLPGTPNQDETEQLLQDQEQEEEEEEIRAFTPTSEPSLPHQDDAEQDLEAQKLEFTPTSEPSLPNQTDAEQPLEVQKLEGEKEIQTPTSIPALKKKSQIPTPNSMRKKSQPPTRTGTTSTGSPTQKSAIPRPRFLGMTEN